MALESTLREIEGVQICDLKGTITAGDSAGLLRQVFKDLLAAGQRQLVVNLKQVDFIDSTGLGTLILGHSTMNASGGGMKLAHLSKRSIELLIITKLSTVFEIYTDVQDAVNSFFPDRAIPRFDILSFVQKK
jgi:anti-sigma B factor antagonist